MCLYNTSFTLGTFDTNPHHGSKFGIHIAHLAVWRPMSNLAFWQGKRGEPYQRERASHSIWGCLLCIPNAAIPKEFAFFLRSSFRSFPVRYWDKFGHIGAAVWRGWLNRPAGICGWQRMGGQRCNKSTGRPRRLQNDVTSAQDVHAGSKGGRPPLSPPRRICPLVMMLGVLGHVSCQVRPSPDQGK